MAVISHWLVSPWSRDWLGTPAWTLPTVDVHLVIDAALEVEGGAFFYYYRVVL